MTFISKGADKSQILKFSTVLYGVKGVFGFKGILEIPSFRNHGNGFGGNCRKGEEER